MKITSQPLTLVDTTDSRKLEVYISSNHPNTQLYNVNNTTNKYTPDWSTTNLKLNADIFLDSKKITPEKKKWYRQTVNGSEEDLFPNTDYTEEVIVSANMTSAIVTYMCKVEYQGLTAFSKITFTKTDTGLNGTNGTPAPAVQAQYSVDGQTNWTATLNAATHKYIRYSYDGGKTWTTAIKMVGEDGTSVNIKGTATSKAEVSGTSYYTLVYNGSTITGASLGDAYLLDGNMYVCVDSKDGNDHFMYVGHIQGPQGNDGQSSYVFIRYAPANPTDSNMSSTPSSTTTHIGICTVNTNNAPKTASSYTWSKFVGDNAKSIILSGTSQIFKVAQGTTPTYTPATITVSAQVINTTVATWEYSVNGGIDWTTVAPDGVSLNTSTNTIIIAGKDLVSNTLVIRASNGVYKDIYTVYKVFDGVNGTPGNPGQPASMAFLTNENVSFAANFNGQISATSIVTKVGAYNGTTKVTPVIGTISGLPSGMTIAPNKGTAYSNTIPTVSNLTVTDLYSDKDLKTKINKTSLSNNDSFVVGDYLYKYNATNQNFVCQTFVDNGTTKLFPNVINNEVVLTLSIANSTTLGITANSYNNSINIPVISPVSTGLTLTWSKINAGAPGTPGSNGADAYTVLLTNESHTFAGEVSNAVNGGVAETQIVAYKGSTRQSVTLKSVDGQAPLTEDTTLINIPGLKFKCNKTVGEDVKITFTCDHTFKTQNGQIPVVLSVNGVEFTKMFTYAIAFKGNTGGTGATGANGSPATAYWLVSSASVVHKTSTGTIAVTPSTLTFTGKSKTGTSAPTDYGCRWIIAYSTDGVKYTDAYISSADEAFKSFDINTTYKTVRTRMYAAGGTAILLDEQIIPVVSDGVKGDKGDQGVAGADAYTVLLTNESHVFAGSTSTAIASSATTQVLAYKGAASQSVTIVSVNGVTASTASTATGIAGLSFQCNAPSGTSPTITFTCTTAFVSPNGTIPIVIKVGNISITKVFTYSIAFKGSTGATGGTGPQGSAATSYWLMSSASVVQKSASGTVVLTPSTLTFTGKSQTGTSTPIDYGCRWIIAYSTDGSTYTNAYTSTANETTKTFTVDSTYKTVRVRMYLAGGTTTLLDEQIIPVVADGAIGTPGTDAVTFQVYSSNGYALSINTPTVTLQTFAYIGDVAITAGATYQWYVYNDSGWTAISGGTNAYLTITREDVAFSKSYMCKMTFNGVEYTSVATIDDKNDENKVFTTKPSNYVAGDLWVVGVDYAPVNVAVGTLLRAEHTSVTYGDADWVAATRYDKELNDLKDNIETYNQYFSFDSAEGLKISAKDNNGTPSQFSTSLTNERLSFNYGNEAIAYINGTKMNIKEAEIESPLTVTGKYSGSTMLQAPVINIGKFSIVVESNGSLSIVANT